jgi:hypothetical protein
VPEAELDEEAEPGAEDAEPLPTARGFDPDPRSAPPAEAVAEPEPAGAEEGSG